MRDDRRLAQISVLKVREFSHLGGKTLTRWLRLLDCTPYPLEVLIWQATSAPAVEIGTIVVSKVGNEWSRLLLEY